jgi:predicted lipoprotein with Yx(FWY)xxD motif
MVGLAALTPVFTSSSSAQSAPAPNINCAATVTGAPTGPATVSAESTPYGRVLIVGSGDEAGCSLYVLSSDRLRALTSPPVPFACSDNANPTGQPCDTYLWPALLTSGAPIAGPGVNPNLLGTVTRNDFPFPGPVEQVTYGGLPLYRVFLDETPAQREGANLFDPVTTPTGIWYLVNPSNGLPAPGQKQMRLETAPVGDTGANATVLATAMNDSVSLFADASFPVYTLSTDQGRTSACEGQCTIYWPPVLTSGQAEGGPNIPAHALGTIVRADGSRQVTYNGQPLYLFAGDVYWPGIPGIPGAPAINGDGLASPWGTFNTITMSS